MKILLILPHDETYRRGGFFRRSLSYAPLTLTTLAALVPPELEAQLELVDEGVQAPVLPQAGYDVVGITCVTASAPRAYELADAFRKLGSRVVLGGSHPTLNPQEGLAHADAVITGPAEQAWPALLHAWAGGQTCGGVLAGRLDPPYATPAPRRDLLPHGCYLPIPTVLAMRGCVNRCSFCSIPRMWGGQAYPRPVAEVIADIQQLPQRRMLFLDPNLMADPAYARELFAALIPLRRTWGGLSTIDLAEDRELFTLAVRSGCSGVLVGFESADDASLRAGNKPIQEASRYREAMRRFHAHGINVLGCFVFGFDQDDESVFARTLEFIAATEIDLPRFAVLTPFPGTPLFAGMERDGRITSRDWKLYDTEHVIFRPARMTAAALQQGLFTAWRAAYTLPQVARRAGRAGHHWPLVAATNLGFRHFAKRAIARGRMSA